jgi:16S rRNA (cytosine967-C5)-methyltransferase
MEALRHRAPVFLRVNAARTDREAAARRLAEEGIASLPHPLSPTALEVTGNARRLKDSAAFREGLVELQDAPRRPWSTAPAAAAGGARARLLRGRGRQGAGARGDGRRGDGA